MQVANRIRDKLTEALAPQGIAVEEDPLYLLGISVSEEDTTVVFPTEFGVFDRFDLDRDLALAEKVDQGHQAHRDKGIRPAHVVQMGIVCYPLLGWVDIEHRAGRLATTAALLVLFAAATRTGIVAPNLTLWPRFSHISCYHSLQTECIIPVPRVHVYSNRFSGLSCG